MIDLDGLAEEAKKENIIAVVALMSKIDGQMHENELVYLLQLGLSMGLTGEKIKEIVLSNDEFVFVPQDEADRVAILYYLIFLIKVDGVVDKKEENLLHHFGFKFGFNKMFIDNLIELTKNHMHEQLPTNALINEMKKYLN